MLELFKKYKKIFITFFVIAFLTPVIVLCPSQIGVIPRSIGIVIVEYIGALLAGLIGFAGIYVTIQNEKEKQHIEDKRKALPLLEITALSAYDYKYKYISFDYSSNDRNIHEEPKTSKDISDTVSISIKNVGYRELYELHIGDFSSVCFAESQKMVYRMLPVLYRDHDLKINFRFSNIGKEKSFIRPDTIDTIISPMCFDCYFKDCYDNWYKQKVEISFMYNLVKDVNEQPKAKNISFERASILSAPEELKESDLPWENGVLLCNC